MSMALNSIAVVQKKNTVETDKKITHFLNYCESHTDAVMKYSRSDIILHLYLDASQLS